MPVIHIYHSAYLILHHSSLVSLPTIGTNMSIAPTATIISPRWRHYSPQVSLITSPRRRHYPQQVLIGFPNHLSHADTLPTIGFLITCFSPIHYPQQALIGFPNHLSHAETLPTIGTHMYSYVFIAASLVRTATFISPS